jgi:hypothetical protein
MFSAPSRSCQDTSIGFATFHRRIAWEPPGRVREDAQERLSDGAAMPRQAEKLTVWRIFGEADFPQKVLGDLQLLQGSTGPTADAHPVLASLGIHASLPGLTPIRAIVGKASEGEGLSPVLACPSFNK